MKMKKLLLALPLPFALAMMSASCADKNEVRHSDYGYCHRAGRHMHNDHVFIGDFHDHSLCEWEKFK